MEMPVKFEVSVMQVGSSLRITIPKEIANHVNIKKGDMVSLWVDDGHIIAEKKKAKEE
jgi:AbrB family looped-hinge helix DNA binding protein